MSPRTLPAISVHQPWAEAIVAGIKDVENRVWRTRHRGLLVIHAAKRWDPHGHRRIPAALRQRARTHAGVLLGLVELVEVVEDSASPWAHRRQFHWVLADPVALPEPVPWRGSQGLFSVPISALGLDPEAPPLMREVR